MHLEEIHQKTLAKKAGLKIKRQNQAILSKQDFPPKKNSGGRKTTTRINYRMQSKQKSLEVKYGNQKHNLKPDWINIMDKVVQRIEDSPEALIHQEIVLRNT